MREDEDEEDDKDEEEEEVEDPIQAQDARRDVTCIAFSLSPSHFDSSSGPRTGVDGGRNMSRVEKG